MGMVSLTTVASFESVGAILVVAMLIAPAATAYLLTERLKRMLVLSVASGVLSAVGGYYLAALLDGSVAGAMAVVAGAQFALAAVASQWRATREQKLAVEGRLPEIGEQLPAAGG